MLRNIVLTLTAALVVTVSFGCGNDPAKAWSSASLYRDGIRTIAIPIWTRGKNVYRRDLEMQLSEALVKQIELDTRYKKTTKARADTLLDGTIKNVSQYVLSVNPDTGAARELEVAYTVDFTWTDLRSGEVLVRRENFRVAGNYVPADPLGERFFQGNEDAVNRLAERIVEQLEADW